MGLWGMVINPWMGNAAMTAMTMTLETMVLAIGPWHI